MEGHKINTAPEFVLTDNLKAHRGLIMSEVPERRRFRKGQQLSRGGTPSPQVYFILEGVARASVVNVYGYERTLGYLRQNTICCMDALRHDAGVSVTITALTTLRAVPLTLADMSRLM
ncbi:MAG TPA: cyclic nucleotide-binding domain-containing protein, partial [Candidatus Scatomorpha stercoravium]|nr:cyclic nucleotide-binding domain-containing protein [Candidatus Scatomorpha stercoravium]